MKLSTLGLAALLSASVLALSGCGEDKAATAATAANGPSKVLRVGVCPGPYGLMVEKALAPELAKDGYTVEVVDFTDYVQPNLALESGDLDANLMQHFAYLDNLVKTQGIKIEAVTNVPTLGMGVFSDKIGALADMEQIRGGQVGLPNDAVNLARALRLAQELGIITLKTVNNETQASIADIDQNPYELEFVPMEAAQISRSLDSVVIGFIPGNYAYAAKLDYSKALGVEQVAEEIKNVVAVQKGDKQMHNLLLRVVHSEGFKQALDAEPEFAAFTRPAWWHEGTAPAQAAAAAHGAAAAAAHGAAAGAPATGAYSSAVTDAAASAATAAATGVNEETVELVKRVEAAIAFDTPVQAAAVVAGPAIDVAASVTTDTATDVNEETVALVKKVEAAIAKAKAKVSATGNAA